MLRELVLGGLLAIGVFAILQVVKHWLLIPSEKTVMLFAVRGNGEDLEYRVRSLGHLYGCRNYRSTIVIVDCGLSSCGLETAQRLLKQHPWLEYCPQPALADYIELSWSDGVLR